LSALYARRDAPRMCSGPIPNFPRTFARDWPTFALSGLPDVGAQHVKN